MIPRILAIIAAAVWLATGAAQAVERTVAIEVANATCALCGPIVKGTLERVAGVSAVTVKEADELSGAVATVYFDGELTTVDTLIAATTNAGYPSEVED